MLDLSILEGVRVKRNNDHHDCLEEVFDNLHFVDDGAYSSVQNCKFAFRRWLLAHGR